MKPKYKNYRELSDAFKKGEIPKGFGIQMDHNGVDNYFCYMFPGDGESESAIEKKHKMAEKLFQCPGIDHEVEELFKALEIPADNC